MDKKINLEEILEKKLVDTDGSRIYIPEWMRKIIYNVSKEACRQVIELCAENSTFYSYDSDRERKVNEEINKQSILDTIKQIEP